MEIGELGELIRPVQNSDSPPEYSQAGIEFASICERVVGHPLYLWQKVYLAKLWKAIETDGAGPLVAYYPRGCAKDISIVLFTAALGMAKIKEEKKGEDE